MAAEADVVEQPRARASNSAASRRTGRQNAQARPDARLHREREVVEHAEALRRGCVIWNERTRPAARALVRAPGA